MAGAVKVQVTVLMAVLIMMVATSVVTVDAGLDFSQILGSFGIQTDSYVTPEYRDDGSACCDLCLCAKSYPPRCRCADVKTTCHEGCKGCLCTKSSPPQCYCTDILNFCYKECTATTTTTTEN